MSEAEPPSPRWPWLTVLVVALAVRVAALLETSRFPFFTHLRLDHLVYHDAALAMARGDLTLGREVLHMSPGYTTFLAMVFAVAGDGPWAWRIAQIALGVASAACIGSAARTLYGERWGIAATAVAALYGPAVFYEQQMVPSALLFFLHSALLALAVRETAGPTRRGVIALGLLWGIAVVVRPNALLLGAPLLLGLAGLRRRLSRQRVGFAALALVAAALVIAPVTLRNRVVGGEWVMVTDSGGLNFYIGNGPGAIGTFRVPDEVPSAGSAQAQFTAFRAEAERASARSLRWREVDAYWFARTRSHIVAHPLEWVRLLAEKAWLFWNAREIPNTEDYTFVRVIHRVLSLPLVQFGALAPLALPGTLLLLWRRRREEAVVAGVNIALMAALTGFFVLAHYRLPAVPGLILAAVGFLKAAVEAGRRRWLFVAAALAVLPVVLAPKLPKVFDDEWFKLGFAYHRQNQLTEAEGAYRTAIALEPSNLSAHKNLAVLRGNLGDREDSRVHWEAVLHIARARQLSSAAREARDALNALNGMAREVR